MANNICFKFPNWKLKQNRVHHLALLELELVELLLDVEEVDPVVRRGELRVQRADRLERCFEEVKMIWNSLLTKESVSISL